MTYFLSRLSLHTLCLLASLTEVTLLPGFAAAQPTECKNILTAQKELTIFGGCTYSFMAAVAMGLNMPNQYRAVHPMAVLLDSYTGQATSRFASDGAVSHLLGYCGQVSGGWKCRCRDTACATPSWQLQSVQMTSDTGENGKLALGVFVNDPELGGGARDEVVMDNFTTLVGGKPAAWLWYETFGTKFPKATFDAVSSRGYTPVLSWAPSRADDSEISWERVAAGDVDDLIYAFARSAATWGKPFYLRPEWEMNLKFGSSGDTPDSFVRMWKRLHDIFVREGAANVRWFWCPNEDGESPQTPYASYYPGDAYVDYVGFDSYNWGTTQPTSHWRSPTETYGPTYKAITKLTNKPVIIGETGSSELGGDKATWIRDAFLIDIPQKYPRVIGVLYFSNDQDGSNWRVNTSSESLAAFKAVVASPLYQGRLP